MKHIVIDARIRRASTGRYVDRLVEHLQKIDNKNRYTILVQPDDPWEPAAPNFNRKFSSYPQFSFNPLHQIGFAWQLYGLRADLVHFPMNQQPVLYFKKVVTSCMDLTMLRFTRPGKHSTAFHAIRMSAYRFLFWYSLKKSSAIIAISKFVKKDLIHHYPFTKNNVTVTYCASEPPLSMAPEPLNEVKKPFIMHVGSPFPHKNIERLVGAFEVLQHTNPNLQLVLAGKKEHYFEQLQKLIATSPSAKDIKVTGFVRDAQLKWLYQNASAYVLPSLSEGFGLPGLEAMAHGCPLASSDATCLPEVYGNAAHYFNPESIEDMATRINEVIQNKQLSDKLVENGHQQLKKYSWRRMAEQTLEIYQNVLG